MQYSELTLWHFEHAVHAGVLAGPGARRGSAGSRAQGTWVQFDVRSDGARVSAASFLAYACPHVIAVADWLCEQAVGSEVRPALPESVALLQRRFALPTEKLGRLLTVEDAWISVMTSPYPV